MDVIIIGMKRFLIGIICVVWLGFAGLAQNAKADECQNVSGALVSPISKNLSIEGGGAKIEDTFVVKNQSSSEGVFKIYVAPFTDDDTKDFTNENRFTQISRWIKFYDISGGVVDDLEIRVPACATREVRFMVDVPASIPDGGQYAVIFVENKNSGGANDVITSSSRVGMLIYARVSGGETIHDAKITDVFIEHNGSVNAGAVAANSGNIDENVSSTLVVRNFFGHEVYRKTNIYSLLPGSSNRKISDAWEDLPYLGLFVVDYTIEVGGETTMISKTILLLPLPVMIVVALAAIIVIIGAISFIKKRLTRRRRLTF